MSGKDRGESSKTKGCLESCPRGEGRGTKARPAFPGRFPQQAVICGGSPRRRITGGEGHKGMTEHYSGGGSCVQGSSEAHGPCATPSVMEGTPYFFTTCGCAKPSFSIFMRGVLPVSIWRSFLVKIRRAVCYESSAYGSVKISFVTLI